MKQFKQNWFTRINILIESVTAELIVKWSLENRVVQETIAV